MYLVQKNTREYACMFSIVLIFKYVYTHVSIYLYAYRPWRWKTKQRNCLLDKSCKGFPTTLWRTFWFETTAKMDGKTEILHTFSPYFLQFFQLSPNFPNDKTELFPSPVGKCLQEHWEGQDFLLQWILPVQECINQRRSLDRLKQMRFNQLHRFCVCDWQAICPVLNPVQALKNCKVGNIKHMGFRVKSGNAPPESSTQLQKHQCCWHWDGNDSRSENSGGTARGIRRKTYPRVGPQASIKHHQRIVFLVCSWMYSGRFLSKRGS